MKIPAEFETRLFQFISLETQRVDGPKNPTDLAFACGEFARRWFGLDYGSEPFEWEQGRALISWAERLGKHVGSFYFNHKEG